MPSLTLSGIYLYPVKSLGGLSVSEAEIGPRGFVHDRHWMLVDNDGHFLSQRTLPRMALIQPQLLPDALVLTAPGVAPLKTPYAPQEGVRIEVRIWDDICQAGVCGHEADAWLSAFLGVDAHLVCLTDDSFRPVDPDYAMAGDQTGFSDGFPFLLISEGSLSDLNRRLPNRVGMERFRPNLVVRGCGAFAEDTWGRIRISDLDFRVAKPCSRCTVTTVDPKTGERGDEPLKTLAGYRQRGNKVYFGQNIIHDQPGKLAVGARIDILEARPPTT